MAGNIGYTTPSVMELFATTFDSFNGQTLPSGWNPSLTFQLEVFDMDDGWYVACPGSSNCKMSYQRDYTPYLEAVTPSNVYKDQLIEFHVNAKNTQSKNGTPADAWPFREIRLGQTLVWWSDGDLNGLVTQDQRLNGFTHATLEAIVGDQSPAANSEPALLFYPGYAYNQPTSKTCNFKGDDCWTVRSHPKIESISQSSGFTNGGQTLSILGWGLNGKDVEISIDGVPCQVIDSTQNKNLTCLTRQAASDSVVKPRPGQPGLLREKIKSSNVTQYPSWSTFSNGVYPTIETNLMTSFETYAYQQDINYQQKLSGWFTAPATANYRFYISCDDSCKLLLDSVNPFSSDLPLSPSSIAYRNSNSNWRQYFHQNGAEGVNEKHISDWIALTAGESYYIEGQHIQWSYSEHFTVSVEIQLPSGNPPNHPKQNVQIQQLAADQNNTQEQWSLLVANPDSGSYNLNFLNPTTKPASLVTYGPISTKASAQNFRDLIYPYYQKYFGTDISVILTMFDSNQVITTDATAAKSYSYQVTVLKQIIGYSINAFTATKVKTNATFTPTPPIKGVKSSAPVNGSFSIVCTDPQGVTWQTEDIAYNTGTDWIQNSITNYIPFLADKVQILPDFRYKYRENGISFLMKFNGLKGTVNPCTLQSGVKNPLTGNSLTYNNTILMQANQTLMFEPVPLEFLSSKTVNPQVLVVIDGIQALCANLTCNYSYFSDSSVVNTQSRTGTTLTLTGLNINFTDIVKVSYAEVDCNLTTASATTIVCTLVDIPVAGDWLVKVFTSNGQVPNNPTLATTLEPLTVNSVSPNTSINYLGGDKLVIQGSGFGYNKSAVNVSMQDGTACDVITVSSTAVVCKLKRFSSTATSPLTVQVSLNGVQDVSQSITLFTQAQVSNSVTPNRVSPVLKQNLVIQLAGNYSGPINLTEFTVSLINSTGFVFTRLYIVSVDSTLRTLTVKFPGAHSGKYYLQVDSAAEGLIDSDDLELLVIGQVLDYQPKSGSIYGGTTITITGENFSKDPLDNPVKIGDDYCYVKTSSATQITCQTDLLSGEPPGEQLLLVFLKTSEEAPCNVTNGCNFNYTIPQSTVTAVSAAFDSSSQSHIVTVTGSGLDASVSVVLDGFKQTLINQTSTLAYFTLVNIDDTKVTHVEVFTFEGYPAGVGNLTAIQLTPTLTSISPLDGSAGSSEILVSGTGFGLQTTGLNLYNSKTNQVLCSKVIVQSYGTFSCLTNPGVISDGSGIQLQFRTQRLSSQNPLLTNYTQVANIIVTNATISGQQITFTGPGFPVAGYLPIASFGGVDADTTVVVTSQEILATWTTTGIAPITAVPVLRFVNSSSIFNVNYAQFQAGVNISKPLIVTSSSSVSCSFEGGCHYTIVADGLLAAMQNKTNQISVCGKPCIIDTTTSSSSQSVCAVPALATTYSVQNYDTESSGVLTGTVFPSNPVLSDGVLTKDYIDTKSTGCNFGMNFPAGYVAVLDEAKIFINFMTTITPYANNLAFYGSNDNWTTSVLLDTFGSEVHEGWNYLNYRDEGNSKPAFNSYKFQGTAAGSCRVTEFRLTGVQSIASNSTNYVCTPQIIIGQNSTGLQTEILYTSTLTPLLTSISPRFGSVLGGDVVTLTGINFSTLQQAQVYFDNRLCSVSSQTSTQIVCTTANKPYVADTPSVRIYIEGQGLVATQGLVFRYASLWSQPQTWGFDIPPQEGDSISIPAGQHLLVDVDSTPVLFAVIVEGSLLFAPNADPTYHNTFDAHYVMVEGGYLEVGTEDFPYTSHLTITMHSDKYSPYLPIYGNKVIGVRFGRLEMHGVTRNITWTTLNQTAEIGATSITLNDYTDWTVGEQIVIAGTIFANNQSETRFITKVNGKVISLDSPLLFSHLGIAPHFGGIEMPMKAEVGLLTRNVLYRGDPETSAANMYGAHIMVHSPGDDSSIGHICYIELQNVGQAFKLGRYPIHFHMIGNVHQSHVIGNAIHDTYNRAITTHGVHYFTVEDNVAFNTMGHTYFIEDAVETNNYYNHNLAIQVKQSMSLLNTDQSPAGFWITHPNNIFTNNAIACTDAYGYWFDMKQHSTGPSFDVNVCGFNDKLGQFSGNTAHSTLKYGLRIFHGLIPRTYPCKDLIYDGDYLVKNQVDPYWQNPVIPAVFENSVFWRNGHNGAIMERAGAVIFKNLKVAENGIAGMEFSLTEDIADGYAKIQGGLVVGDAQADYFSAVIRSRTNWGVITPRTENFTVEGVSFFNLDYQGSAALGDCSHCFHPASTDSGARTVKTANLTFDTATVPVKIRYQFPNRGIWHDLDGSLTGLGPNTWSTPNWIHNVQPECTLNIEVFAGVICDSTVQVRRVTFSGFSPSSLEGLPIRIAQWDDDFAATIESDNTTLFDFQQDVDGKYFSLVPFKPKLAPMKSWAVPFVTGHKYRIHWGWANDFDKMSVEVQNRWVAGDKNVHFMTNFTDVRVAINVTTKYGSGDLIGNGTYLGKTEAQLVSGDNVVFNETSVREFHFVVNGQDMTNKDNLLLTGIRCWPGTCFAPVPTAVACSTEVNWSDPTAWPSGKVPAENDTVSILPGVCMVLDINTPILKMLTINGRLRFQQNGTAQDLTLNAYIVFVAEGQLLIGSSTNPYNGTATIRLYGISTDQTLAYDTSIYGGNKMIANLGLVSFHGKPRSRNSRLRAPVNRGETAALVDSGLDWQAGDRVYLAPTATQHSQSDYMNILSYNIQTGAVTFTKPLTHYHWGDYYSTASAYNGVDMRGEVVLLSRNVRVVGNDTGTWGGQIVTSDTIDNAGNIVGGQLFFDNVEVYNCSQQDTYQSAIRFEGANTNYHVVNNSVVHEGWGWSFLSQMSSNILIKNSDFIQAKAIGFSIQASNNITVDGVMQADVTKRILPASQAWVDKESCFSICSYVQPDYCSGISITNSVAVGCTYAGFVVPGHECGQSQTQKTFRNNVAHSISGSGAIIFPDISSSTQSFCYEGSYFSAYKCEQAGIATMFEVQIMNMTRITMIDNVMGISLQQGAELDQNSIQMTNVMIYGETKALDCPDLDNCLCMDKMGFMLSGSNEHPKKFHINTPSSLPMYKIKSYGAWNASTSYKSVTFSNFMSNTTACGSQQVIFGVNPFSADYIPLQKFTDSKFVNVVDSAMAFFMPPNPAWQNPDDCIGFPCTAPSNIVITHDRVQYSGITPDKTPLSFQIVSNTDGASQAVSSCSLKSPWNAWYCVNMYLGVLEFQSLDADQEKRNISPVYVYNNETGFINKLNVMMDHTWDGFYTGQFHKSQFPSLIQTYGNYTVEYTGTVPGNMRYALRAERGAIKVHVPYWNAGSYAVKNQDGVTIPTTPWDSKIGSAAELTGMRGCGENRFVGVKNYLEFWLTAGCTLTVVPVDAIMANVRLAWTLAEFYASGGTVSFTDRVAGALGIQAYQIKTVAVYAGSVIIQYTISAATNDLNSNKTLASLSTKLNALVASNNSAVFGAPILNATTNGNVIYGGTPKTTTQTTTANQTVVAPTPIIQVAPANTTTNKQQQVIVIVVVVVVIAVAVAAATAIFIRNKGRKVSDENKKAAGSAEAGVVQSEVELNPQFHPEPATFDVDIFTNKKRALKMNDDEVTNKYYDSNPDQFNSNLKLQQSTNEVHSRIEMNQNSKLD